MWNRLIPFIGAYNMAKGRTQRRDAMDGTIESALHPGRFIGWNGASAFVSDLRHVESEIAKVVRTDPAAASRCMKPSSPDAL
ncbi:MAG: hypothetical protein ACRD7E_01640 [Bryobacteraceae bacterium]